MKLSLVELATVSEGEGQGQALSHALDAVVHAERAGFHRVWFAEHHLAHGFASHAPELLIAAATRETSRIRLGSGAVLLNHYSPFRVAETYMQLEAMAPGRIDLGLGRATAGPVIDTALKRDRRSPHLDDFAEQVQEILALVHGLIDKEHPFHELDFSGLSRTAPQLWILGSSGNSAGLAARLGLGYTFAAFINPSAAAAALGHYRDQFTPQEFGFGTPQGMLAMNIVVADTDEEARRLTWPARALYARLGAAGQRATAPSVDIASQILTEAQKDEPTVITNGRWPRQLAGSPATVRAQLERMTQETGAQEIMLQDIIPDHDTRLHSHALLAGALDHADIA
ncbi:alkane monooxygenase (plasmid) [Arthrobacter sp. MN05-02]|nr:alkane monooxygenase [Arthrobacter sp. MN05-02]